MLKRVSILFLLLISTPVWSARPSAEVELNRWLDKVAGPQLTEKLANHPKFKGSTIGFAPASNNQLNTDKNKLYQEIEQHLTHQILSAGKTDIATSIAGQGCQQIRQATEYIVGIQIVPVSGNNYRVQLKVMDRQQGVWVSGISYRWHGRLSKRQMQQLEKRSAVLATGTIDRPFAIQQQQLAAVHLLEQVHCSLPIGIDGLVYLKPSSHSAQDILLNTLQQSLQSRPQWVFTRQQLEAAWLLELELVDNKNTHNQWLVSLTPNTASGAPQILASTFWQAAASDPAVAQQPERREETENPSVRGVIALESAPAPIGDVLGRLSWRTSKACRNQTRHCVEITLNLSEPAYVMLVRTHDQQIKTATCDQNLQLKQPGKLRYRISMPRQSRQPTGVYAIASQSKETFEKLQRNIHGAPGSCSSTQQKPQTWLTSASRVLSELAEQFDWRSLHLTDKRGSVSRL